MVFGISISNCDEQSKIEKYERVQSTQNYSSSSALNLTYLLLSPTFGMHQYTADLANRMSDIHSVSLITTDTYPNDRYSPGINITTPISTSNTGFSSEGLKFNSVKRIQETLEELSPELVHITGPHLWNLMVVRWLRRRDIPVIHTIHDLDPHRGSRYGRLQSIWNKLIIGSVDHVLVHGEIYRERLIRAGSNPDFVTAAPILHLFIGNESRTKAESMAQTPAYHSQILFFGRLEEYKGINLLLEAYRLLSAEADHNQMIPSLILAGKGSLSEKSMSNLPPRIDLRDRFIPDQEALELFQESAIVVFPYVDGTQTALIPSAYYFSKPVISSRVGALTEYVEDGVTGLLVEPDNPKALAESIAGVIFDESRLRTMGTAGREWYDNQQIQEQDKLAHMYDQVRMNSINAYQQ